MTVEDMHCVKVTFEPISPHEMEILLDEDERLNALFEDIPGI